MFYDIFYLKKNPLDKYSYFQLEITVLKINKITIKNKKS